MVGCDERPPWLAADRILEKFGSRRRSAISRYVEFVEAGVGRTSVWDGLCGPIYLGSEDFALRMQAQADVAETLSEVPRRHRRPVVWPIAHFAANACDRRHAMALAYLSGEHSMKAIAEYFGVHYATVSRAVKVHEVRNGDG